MQIARTQLQATLKMATLMGASGFPFIGLKLTDEGLFFHRSGQFGYIETDGYSKQSVIPIVVSLQHLNTVVGVMQGENLNLIADKQGILQVTGHGSDIKVFTVKAGTPWNKSFATGSLDQTLEPTLFEGITLAGMGLSAPPYLGKGHLILPTQYGIGRKTLRTPDLPTSPREEFLRIISGKKLSTLVSTTKGYWGAKVGDAKIVVAGHTSGEGLANKYSGSLEPLVHFEAPQFLYALGSVIDLTSDEDRISLTSAKGFEVHTSLGNSRFEVKADNHSWPNVSIMKGTCKMLLNCLQQDASDTLTLSPALGADTYRFARGSWDLTFVA